MKIRVGTLRRLLREVAISPSVFKNAQANQTKDIMERPNIAKAIAALEAPFKNAIEMNLTLQAHDQYDEQTRELDDAAYERIKTVSEKATEMMMAGVHKAVQGAFAQAMKGAGEEKPAVAAPPKKAVA
jgi:hypothetical protein